MSESQRPTFDGERFFLLKALTEYWHKSQPLTTGTSDQSHDKTSFDDDVLFMETVLPEIEVTIDGLISQLVLASCPPEDVERFVEMGRQTLASLYKIVKQQSPSPTEMRKLALRYALDPRTPIDDINRFKCEFTATGSQVTEFPHLGLRYIGQKGVTRPITNLGAARLLQLVFTSSPPPLDIMLLVEGVLGCVPGPQDGLSVPGPSLFYFKVDSSTSGRVHVRLWIDDKEVPLNSHNDVHMLLKLLCDQPDARYPGRQLAKRGVTNASQAVKLIKTAMESVHIGAELWLCTKPIHWHEDHRPTKRPSGKRPKR